MGGCSFVFQSVIVFLTFSDFSVVLFSSIITRSERDGVDARAKLLRVYSLSGEKKIQFNTYHTSLLGLLVSLFSFFDLIWRTVGLETGRIHSLAYSTT